jgi:hypothetical protein
MGTGTPGISSVAAYLVLVTKHKVGVKRMYKTSTERYVPILTSTTCYHSHCITDSSEHDDPTSEHDDPMSEHDDPAPPPWLGCPGDTRASASRWETGMEQLVSGNTKNTETYKIRQELSDTEASG